MKTLTRVAAAVLVAGLVATPVSAQPPTPGTDPHHPAPSPGASAAPAPSTPPKHGERPMMDMCRQMMADMTGPSMMGGGAAAGPKERADMLHMRGEMMKAMGDIMMKHARRMQTAPGK